MLLFIWLACALISVPVMALAAIDAYLNALKMEPENLEARRENGGGHRLLGQLNARASKIPFITWWVDHNLAISELRLSLQIAPNSLLQDIVRNDPDPDRLVEDTRVIEDAGTLLDENLP